MGSGQSIKETRVTRHKDGDFYTETDSLAREEPLEVRIKLDRPKAKDQPIYLTMRTPGHDRELAAGFLFSEGVLRNREQILEMESMHQEGASILRLVLKKENSTCLKRLERNFSGNSSCGVCGKTSLKALRTQMAPLEEPENNRVSSSCLNSISQTLFSHQKTFHSTGGLHGCGLFDFAGNLCCSFEDIGRHNAVDKLIGSQFLKGNLALHEHILLLSGRAGFELVQKSIAAKIPILAAIGAPSSLAVEMSEAHNQTLAGFLGQGRISLYSHPKRISFES